MRERIAATVSMAQATTEEIELCLRVVAESSPLIADKLRAHILWLHYDAAQAWEFERENRGVA